MCNVPDMQALAAQGQPGDGALRFRAVRAGAGVSVPAHAGRVRAACAGRCPGERCAHPVGRVLARTARDWGLR